MKNSEKILLSIVAGIALVWFVAWPMIQGTLVAPIRERNEDLLSLQETLARKDRQRLELMQATGRLQDWRRQSLPPGGSDAQRLYQEWLDDLVKHSGFREASVVPRAVPGRTVRSGPAAFSAVGFTVEGRATLEQLARFLYHFHRADLLHHIAEMKLESAGSEGNPLITISALNVEALALSDAPPRDRLFPVTTLAAPLPATETTLRVASPDGFPEEPGFRVRVGGEYLTVTGMQGAAWTVARGADATTAASHPDKAPLELAPVNPRVAGRTPDFYRDLVAAGPFVKPRPTREYRPRLEGGGDKTALRGTPLEFTLRARDLDPGQGEASFHPAEEAPAGFKIDKTSGEAVWEAPSDLPAGTYPVTVEVRQVGLERPVLTERLRLVLRDPLVIEPIEARTIYVGQTLSFPVRVQEPGDPSRLTYRLGAGAPAGATIDSRSGAFTWTPPESADPGRVEITFEVSDGAADGLSASRKVAFTLEDDTARHTFFNAAIAEGDRWQAWLRDRLSNRQIVVEEGSRFTVSDITGEVLEIRHDLLLVRADDAVWKLKLGTNLRSMEKLEAVSTGSTEARDADAAATAEARGGAR